ncbi:bifunctional farnesyl-diphosphate farnesyltransferase/squalene synthase [Clydaea vesicula]|uniref:Bifunctional farnesyl-diphosphate farnesyltransferase/squalene synthase n=1 Tax=Clydaea vesicula TaxID=447962 RepID=A0AAD5XX38_9FUNG|nr:bifunctional farnesyl-diphosphate farnesyltransferase/squalene synthase [Clydaea vesicula]
MASTLLSSLFHPQELHALIKFKLTSPTQFSYASPNDIPFEKGDKEYSKAKTYYFLNLTSRSFTRVIQELHEELRHPICIFYLVLRGLDTVEDDLSIDYEEKVKILTNFHGYIYQEGWTYNGNADSEKDKPLLVEFNYVIEEFLKLKDIYKTVIANITKRMGSGMAEFRHPDRKVVTIKDYNLYTHFVAGLVGIGLTALFVNSGLEKNPKLILAAPENSLHYNSKVKLDSADQENLPNRMGLFLQKINIIKDFMEDLEQGRVFWPEEIWKAYVEEGEDLKSLALVENRSRALAVLNHLWEGTTVFKFAAIPQIMAMASLNLFFNNSLIFGKKPLKIRRGTSAHLIINCCEDIETLKKTYQKFIYELHKKNHDAIGKNSFDKSFVKIAVNLGSIQRWINIHTMQRYSSSGGDLGTLKALELSSNTQRGCLDYLLVIITAVAAWYILNIYL